MKIQSNTETFRNAQEEVYDTLVNFTKRIQVPAVPKISNWSVTDDTCSFTLNGMITCQLRLTEQVPCSKVCYHIDTDKRISADAVVNIAPAGEGSTVQVEAEADVPFFMQALIKGPVEQALNQAISKIKEMAERGEYGI